MGKNKRFAITPIKPLELEFPDGRVIEAIFTVETFLLMSEEFGDLATLAKEEREKPYDLAAKILYSGIKVLDSSATYEESKSIIVGGGLPLIEAIFESVLESFDGIDMDDDDIKKKAQKLAMEIYQG